MFVARRSRLLQTAAAMEHTMDRWTRRGVMGAGAALVGGAALAADAPLASLLADGPDGLLSAGVIARRGDGKLALAAAAGRKLKVGAATPPILTFGLDDPFRVGAPTELVTTVGFMRLVEANLATPDDDVSARLGFKLRHPSYPDKPILIRHLLSHTSGLRDGPSSPVPAGHLLREAFEPSGRHWDGGAWFGPPDKAPGDWFAHADVNVCLIVQILERAINERFDVYISRAVMAPLDLDAGLSWSGVSQPTRDRVAPGCRWLEGRWTAQVDDVVPAAPGILVPQAKDGPNAAGSAGLGIGENGFLFSPQGGLRLSLRHMDRLAQAMRSGGELYGVRIGAKASFELMEAPAWRYDEARPNGDTGKAGSGNPPGGLRGYGFGVEIPQGYQGPGGDAFFGTGSEDWRGRLGDAYGWMTGLFWNRKDGRTLVWALNGMRETGRAPGRRSALTPQEETIIDIGLAALA
jgi:CubicO group peptidase (beta-lactamase class C family)